MFFNRSFGFVFYTCFSLVGSATVTTQASDDVVDNTKQVEYSELVLSDKPIAYWRMEDANGKQISNVVRNPSESKLDGDVIGNVLLRQAGPRPSGYTAFKNDNHAIAFFAEKGYVRVKDPGADSLLDFSNGDAITLEAWIKPNSIANDQHLYIVGKGRTNRQGVARDNQNYALRLRGMGGTARISFLFRSAANRKGVREDFHRWNSDLGFVPDGRWHHVAVCYTFGKPETISGYLDGQPIAGTWDIGGATTKPPLVDNDELWIGSSIGGSSSVTFNGMIDEVAIYRSMVDAKRMRSRYVTNLPNLAKVELADKDLPDGSVLVEIHEGIPAKDSWAFSRPAPIAQYDQPTFGFVGVPKKYSAKGLVIDRTNPFLLRARAKRRLTAGDYEFMLRAKSAARLFVDGKLIVETKFMSHNSSGHEAVPKLAAPQQAGLHPLAPGHQERVVSVKLDNEPHVFCLEIFVGGKGLRAELGEACVALARKGKPFALLGSDASDPVSLSENTWLDFAASYSGWLEEVDAKNRHEAAPEENEYWHRRHEIARGQVAMKKPPIAPKPQAGTPINNDIDRFLAAPMRESGEKPAPLISDYAFLRRVTLDTIGLIPTRQEIAALKNDKGPNRRSVVIDRLLDDLRWADHWVSYWQDVLAENPGILKPKLNNTGPFRFWIYESFRDNKAFDRFVTELILMGGSKHGGGPAGFGMATQNDVPMAAKAHVLAQAFLGLEMKCARCHDAPFHSYKQKDLFNLAAMLGRNTITLPKTSTVPIAGGARKLKIEITLKPGEKISAVWPFGELASQEKLPRGILRNPTDARERLAAMITSPNNERFAQVIVNRLWRRWMGRGMVEPVDDWEGAKPSHPRLLEFLARELVLHDYDLKHVARLILNSHAYQREVRPTQDVTKAPRFAAQTRRRMSAEQIVDSAFAAAHKPFNTEQLTFDPEGRRGADTFLNLGAPKRAWEFASLANERDRPALALPMAQTFVDLLTSFGWRQSRPNPLTVRDETPTMLQPLALANGLAGRRVVRLSDDNAITNLCLEDFSVGELVEQVCLQILSRPPTSDEKSMFVDVLADGFERRRVETTGPVVIRQARRRTAVSWANHLSAEATTIKLELERAARAGDPPTKRLQADWRERMEDIVWALFNSPEFVFVP